MARSVRFASDMEPLQIYHDGIFDDDLTVVGRAPMPLTKSPRKPLQPASTNTMIDPLPPTSSRGISPLKPRTTDENIPILPSIGNGNGNGNGRGKGKGNLKQNMVPIPPPAQNRRQTDSLRKKAPPMSRFKTTGHKPLAPAVPMNQQNQQHNRPLFPLQHAGKENAQPTLLPAPSLPMTSFSMSLTSPIMSAMASMVQAPMLTPSASPTMAGILQQKASGKRGLMDAAPIADSRPQKKAKVDLTADAGEKQVPAHDSFSPIHDDGQKPSHSYATLIAMAILRSPQRRLTLSQIYKWISDTYSFYAAQESGWQNSIRHNLSLNKAFIKQERPKDDKGKGNYWTIQPGMEGQFLRDRSAKTLSAATPTLASPELARTPQLPLPHPAPSCASNSHMDPQEPLITLAPNTSMDFPKLQPGIITCKKSSPVGKEPSSDTTIPCLNSDTAEDGRAKVINAQNSAVESPHTATIAAEFYSPIATTIHSSPPVPRQVSMALDNGTTPLQVKQLAGSSISRSHKRNLTSSMDDSGYFSSIGSSALRRPAKSSSAEAASFESDHPPARRGRPREMDSDLGSAEAEIRRIRASSHDSPSRSRVASGSLSSPFRNDSRQMPPPITPAMKLKAQVRPPQSVSPNTNLRMHRDRVSNMLQSPLRKASVLEEQNSWSPAFRLDDAATRYSQFVMGPSNLGVLRDSMFDALDDSPFKSPVKRSAATYATGSPIKRPLKRPTTLDRTRSVSDSAHALLDITDMASPIATITSAPVVKAPARLTSDATSNSVPES